MDSCRKRPQALDQSGCGRVEKFVANTVDAAGLNGAHLAPATVADDLFQRHAITRAAPGRDKDVGVLVKHCLGQALRTCFADELAMMARGPVAASGHTSTQYFVQATIRSSFPMAARITVALGWRLTTRRGVWSAGIGNLMVQGFGSGGLILAVASEFNHEGHDEIRRKPQNVPLV